MTASMFLKRVNTRATLFPCVPRHLKIAPGHGLHQRKSVVICLSWGRFWGCSLGCQSAGAW